MLRPDNPSFTTIESLNKQIERVKRQGTQIEVTLPGEEIKAALASVGGNALDPSLREIAANTGQEQSRREAARVSVLWR